MYILRKCLLVSMALLFVTAGLFATGDDEASAGPVDITMLVHEWPKDPIDMDWPVWEELRKQANVNIVAQLVPQADWKAKRDILLNSGDLPDLLPTVSEAASWGYGAGGLLLNMTKHADKLPALDQKIDLFGIGGEIDSKRDLNGDLWGVPGFSQVAFQGHAWIARQDLIDKFNIEWPPANLDDLTTALQTVQDGDDKIKYAYSNKLGMSLMLTLWGPVFGVQGRDADSIIYDKDADNWYHETTSSGFKAMLVYLNELYEAGLLDPEIPTLASSQWMENVANGQYFLASDWAGNSTRYNAGGVVNTVDSFFMQPVLPPIGPSGKMMLNWISRSGTGLMVAPATLEDDERLDDVLGFLNFLFTDEGVLLLTWGVEGHTFDVISGTPPFNGKAKFRDEFYLEDGSVNKAKFNNESGYAAIYGLSRVQPADKLYAWNLGAGGPVKDYYELMAPLNIAPPGDPVVKLSVDETEEANLLIGRIKGYTDEMIAKFIYGQVSIEDEWDAYVAETKSLGRNKLVQLINNAWSK